MNVLHMGHLTEASVHLHLLNSVDQSAKGPLLHQLLSHHFGPDHDVGVAEGILGMARRACARFCAPAPKAPAAQEHDKPKPGSHGSCCGPLRGLPLFSSKLLRASADATIRAHSLGLTVQCARWATLSSGKCLPSSPAGRDQVAKSG